jgi:hypothetical protein
MEEALRTAGVVPGSLPGRTTGRANPAPISGGRTMRGNPAIEERLGHIIVGGSRHEMWVRSQPDDDGTWHNVLLFRRDGRVPGADVRITGVPWHVPPGIALQRARELAEEDRIQLFQRALRPRPPIA